MKAVTRALIVGLISLGFVPRSAPASEQQTAAVLRMHVESQLKGTPQFSAMEPDLAQRVREQWPSVWPWLQSFGQLRSIEFYQSADQGDYYLVTCEHKKTRWLIKLAPNGKTQTLRIYEVQ